jgi:hypothetical protein
VTATAARPGLCVPYSSTRRCAGAESQNIDLKHAMAVQDAFADLHPGGRLELQAAAGAKMFSPAASQPGETVTPVDMHTKPIANMLEAFGTVNSQLECFTSLPAGA